MKTTNSYEAAYYLMYGAILKKITVKKLAENKWDKRGYRKECTFEIVDIPEWAIELWENRTSAFGNIKEYIYWRRKLKKKMNEALYQ